MILWSWDRALRWALCWTWSLLKSLSLSSSDLESLSCWLCVPVPHVGVWCVGEAPLMILEWKNEWQSFLLGKNISYSAQQIVTAQWIFIECFYTSAENRVSIISDVTLRIKQTTVLSLLSTDRQTKITLQIICQVSTIAVLHHQKDRVG